MSGSPRSIVAINASSTGGKIITSAVSSTVAVTTVPGGQKVSVVAGVAYTASLWVWITAATSNFSCSIDWSDGNHNYMSTSPNNVSITPGTWTFVTNTYLAPAGARYANISAALSGNPPATNIYYIDDVQLSSSRAPSTNMLSNPTFETSVASWYPSGGTLIQSNIQAHSGTQSARITPTGSVWQAVVSSEQVPAVASSSAPVVITSSTVGRKTATGAESTPIGFITTVTGGQPRNAKVAATVAIVPSSVGRKVVTSSITTSVVINASTVAGFFESSLTGYGAGSDLDQSATWAAIILRMRMGQPVGDDVDSLKALYRYGRLGAVPGQFVANLTAPQQSLGAASWAVLAASGGLMLPPLVLPPLGADIDLTYVASVVSNYYPGSLLFPGPTIFPTEGKTEAQVKAIALEMTSTSENSTKDWRSQYVYIEDIHDGRGYTGGIAGFCSGTGDMLSLIQYYTQQIPGNILSGYVPKLQQIMAAVYADRPALSHSLLDPTFVPDWKTASATQTFKNAQDYKRDTVYWTPAYKQAIADGLSPLGKALYYDISLNHGPGTDPDSFGGIVAGVKAGGRLPPSHGGDEANFLIALCDARDAVLRRWGDFQASGRSNMYRKLTGEANFDLNFPFSWSVYGTTYSITSQPL